MVKIQNLTPHPITLRVGEKEVVFPPSGQIVRMESKEESLPSLSFEGVEIPLMSRSWGRVDLPAPEEGTFFIVSSLVFEAAEDRNDLLVPDTGASAIRDKLGQIVAVRRFIGRRQK